MRFIDDRLAEREALAKAAGDIEGRAAFGDARFRHAMAAINPAVLARYGELSKARDRDQLAMAAQSEAARRARGRSGR